MATKLALKVSDIVVTEAGFGADLGAEKFFNIVCRSGDLRPDGAVLVATVRALKMHGGVASADLEKEDLSALRDGASNLARHVENLRLFGVPIAVAINRFVSDTDSEVALVKELCSELDVAAFTCTHWSDGGAGTVALAEHVAKITEAGASNTFTHLYPDDMPLWDKTRTVAQKIYRARDITADEKVRAQFDSFQEQGFGHFPVCIAKTQYSFSTDPSLKGAPTGHTVPIREVRLAAGAEFLVAICGDIMTMPGLPRHPAAEHIGVNERGEIFGLS